MWSQLVDSSGEGVVALHRLVQCLQSVEFSRVVSTSLALSTIFHGGSYATSSNSNSNDVPSQAAGTGTGGQPMAQARGEEDKKEKVKETEGRTELKGSSKGVRAVSSVSVAGTVADIPSLLPVFIDTFSAPAPPEEPNPDPGEPQQQGQQAQAQDWISKLDFLEFCQAVVDIKRYSVGGC